MGGSVHRDLTLLHGFQQGSLCLWGGAVDFIRQNNLPHDRPRPEFELAFLLIENGNARHVARKHVGRELNTVERTIQRFSKAPCQHGLAYTWHILNQNVSLTE